MPTAPTGAYVLNQYNGNNLTLLVPADTTLYWTRSSDGNWNVASNWSTDAVPTSADDVVIEQPGNVTVTITDAEQANTVASSDTLTIQGSLLGGSGVLSLTGASQATTLNIAGGTLSSAGTITVTGPMLWSGVIEGGGTVTANGGMSISGDDINFGENVLTNATLINNGTVNWTSGSVAVVNDGGLVNSVTGTINDSPQFSGPPNGFLGGDNTSSFSTTKGRSRPRLGSVMSSATPVCRSTTLERWISSRAP